MLRLVLGQRATLRDAMPVIDARSATRSGRMLRVEDDISREACLATVSCRFRAGHGRGDPPRRGGIESGSALAKCVVHRLRVEGDVPEVVPNQLVAQLGERVVNVVGLALMNPGPVDELSVADSAGAFETVGAHLPGTSEAM